MYGWVSDTSDNKGIGGWLQKKNNNWFFSLGNDVWNKDATLTVVPGGLQVTCRTYQVAATGPAAEKYRDSMGLFTVTNQWRNGRPLYRTSNGHLLYVCDGGQWCLGDQVGHYGIRSRDKPVFPEGVRYWVFWDGSSAQQAQVSVSCVAAV